jgi:hypothetical protein
MESTRVSKFTIHGLEFTYLPKLGKFCANKGTVLEILSKFYPSIYKTLTNKHQDLRYEIEKNKTTEKEEEEVESDSALTLWNPESFVSPKTNEIDEKSECSSSKKGKTLSELNEISISLEPLLGEGDMKIGDMMGKIDVAKKKYAHNDTHDTSEISQIQSSCDISSNNQFDSSVSNIFEQSSHEISFDICQGADNTGKDEEDKEEEIRETPKKVRFFGFKKTEGMINSLSKGIKKVISKLTPKKYQSTLP